MKIDIATLLLMNIIVNAVSSWAMAVIWRENRRQYQGIGFWMANMTLQTVGLGLVLLRGVVIDLVSIVLANLTMLAGAVLLLIGLERFVERPSGHWRLNAVLLALFAVVMAHFTYLRPEVQPRQIAVSSMIILIMGQAWLLLSRRAAPKFRSITNIAAHVLLGFVAASVLRIAMIVAGTNSGNDFFASGLANALAITLYTTLNACLAICLVLVVNRRLLADMGEMKDELEIMATHDQLTGLPNRTLFQDRFALALSGAKRDGTLLAIMSLDLDLFKQVNDTLGHAAGDALLKETARRISGALRGGDTVARFGGDEFVLLLRDLECCDDARRAAEKVLEAMRSPFDLGGQEAAVSASIGIALSPADGEEAEDLIHKSDMALYQAKTQGRNTLRFHC